MLDIKNLKVKINEKVVINDINLKINDGEIHVLMGPNGAGKSTLCKVIMHAPNYEIEKGEIEYKKEKITNKNPSDIAKMGIYYISQNPIEIEGITNAELLRTAMSEQGISMDIFSFQKKCNEICEKLKMPKNFIHRHVNVGMSGGERKKNELLGMWLLEPSLVLLDEIDSGLDVDAIKTVGENLKEYQQKTNASLVVVTHQQQLINILNPDHVHILKDGKLEQSGDIALAKKVEKEGFLKNSGTNNVSGSGKNE